MNLSSWYILHDACTANHNVSYYLLHFASDIGYPWMLMLWIWCILWILASHACWYVVMICWLNLIWSALICTAHCFLLLPFVHAVHDSCPLACSFALTILNGVSLPPLLLLLLSTHPTLLLWSTAVLCFLLACCCGLLWLLPLDSVHVLCFCTSLTYTAFCIRALYACLCTWMPSSISSFCDLPLSCALPWLLLFSCWGCPLLCLCSPCLLCHCSSALENFGWRNIFCCCLNPTACLHGVICSLTCALCCLLLPLRLLLLSCWCFACESIVLCPWLYDDVVRITCCFLLITAYSLMLPLCADI